jgi:hypothetical protein
MVCWRRRWSCGHARGVWRIQPCGTVTRHYRRFYERASSLHQYLYECWCRQDAPLLHRKAFVPLWLRIVVHKVPVLCLSITDSVIPPTPNASFGVTATVTNVGAVTSDEVVQVYTAYLAKSSGNASYPLQQLQKFQRLKSVAPSTQQQVSFTISGKDLLLMNPAGEMVVNPGDYLLWLGGCSPNSESYGCSPILNTTFTVSSTL